MAWATTTCVLCRRSVQYYRSTIEPKYCVECGPDKPRTLAAEQHAREAIALRDQGLHRWAIAERLGISRTALNSLLKRHPPGGLRAPITNSEASSA